MHMGCGDLLMRRNPCIERNSLTLTDGLRGIIVWHRGGEMSSIDFLRSIPRFKEREMTSIAS